MMPYSPVSLSLQLPVAIAMNLDDGVSRCSGVCIVCDHATVCAQFVDNPKEKAQLLKVYHSFNSWVVFDWSRFG